MLLEGKARKKAAIKQKLPYRRDLSKKGALIP